jgi:hypothetical protein
LRWLFRKAETGEIFAELGTLSSATRNGQRYLIGQARLAFPKRKRKPKTVYKVKIVESRAAMTVRFSAAEKEGIKKVYRFFLTGCRSVYFWFLRSKKEGLKIFNADLAATKNKKTDTGEASPPKLFFMPVLKYRPHRRAEWTWQRCLECGFLAPTNCPQRLFRGNPYPRYLFSLAAASFNPYCNCVTATITLTTSSFCPHSSLFTFKISWAKSRKMRFSNFP